MTGPAAFPSPRRLADAIDVLMDLADHVSVTDRLTLTSALVVLQHAVDDPRAEES